MGARIINFPLNKILPTKNLPYGSAAGKNAASEQNLTDYRKNREIKTLGDIMRDEELSREMFSPDYFMLVE